MNKVERTLLNLVQLFKGIKDVTDLADYPLPLYLRHSAGLGPAEPPKVLSCSKCATRYFERTTGCFVPEDGKCHACSTGKPRATAAPRYRPTGAYDTNAVTLRRGGKKA